MNLVRKAAIKSNRPLTTFNQNQRLSLTLLSQSYSTEEAPNQNPKPFLQTPHTGLFYGKLFGITRRTTKSDILTLLENCNVSLDDIRIGHNRAYTPVNLVIQFPSYRDYEAAIRSLNRRGRFYRLDKSDRNQWDYTTAYDGKVLLLQGISKLAQIDDVERFLSGCAYDPTSMQLFSRKTDPDSESVRMATIHFPTRTQAAYAFLKTNREFLLNEQILARVLE